jgi:hypothetical protein
MDDNLFDEEVEAFLQSFLTEEDDPAEDFKDGSLMLLAAAQDGRTAIVRALLRGSKINVKGRDLSGDTALHHAVRHGFVEIAKLLLRQIGTGVNIVNQEGETALIIATRGRDSSRAPNSTRIWSFASKLTPRPLVWVLHYTLPSPTSQTL